MMIDSVSAIGGSQSLSGVRAAAAAAPTEGPSFGQALAQVVGSAIDTLQTGEAVAIQGVEGAAPPMKVVESVMAAQRSLQTVLAIRDKAVSAYQEIAHMAI
ncbi:MAG TPA: flagellar hook-basal body complex protein FliE [Roseiarcus sp.]|nr:flagellar hook-basal body complex protein FliE [Roseiarcus sp.]